MKKSTRISHKEFSAGWPHSQQMRSRSNIRWLIVVACCCVTFIGVFGIANAAWTSGGAVTLGQKMQGYQHLVNQARQHARPKPDKSLAQAPAVQPAPTRHTGIVNLGQGPFPRSVFAVNTFWQGSVGNDWVLAYAGSKTNVDGNAGPGGIVLYTETINKQGGLDLHPVGTFLAPNGATALTITAQQGNLLLLHNGMGRQVTFNLVSHQYQ